MKKVDVLFLYETKVRELENICLLKYELERRGYSVAVLNTWNEIANPSRPKYDAKVVVTHAMYHDGIFQFVQSIVGNVPKVVNMQCEQIGTVKDEETEDNCFILRGVAEQCLNICWGRRTAERLKKKCGFDDKHVYQTGQIALDFCRPKFRKYYLSREELQRKYALPLDKQINLFISSFSYVNLPQDILDQSDLPDKDQFVNISMRSYQGMLRWIERLLQEHPEQVMIYRPHPAESDSAALSDLKKQYPEQLYVICELSVKQWLAISDRAYTWYSTSAAEACVFDVPCAILRPEKLPEDMELSLFENASLIETYEAFERTLEQGCQTSVNRDVFDELYDVQDTYSYVRIADAIEIVLKDPGYRIKNPPTIQDPTITQRIKTVLYRAVCKVAEVLPKSVGIADKYRKKEKAPDPYHLKLQRNNYATDEEILQIQNKIAKVLEADTDSDK